ncbi:outer membrane protein [Terrihabitans rhizophilus]|uniref:Outer membrane protein n=1 Tax=Terrihabitans rhizophilus TaxID=3092662 RepID=A0ABU4RQA1_9HYPH|nr:outer membrane protein [Terrihabitans sp. PJ23]MDX6807014.1 outer membrane protein [Terrihabitans sp. PJ23]
MRNLLTSLAVAGAAMSAPLAASAADVPYYGGGESSYAAPATSASNWTGFYVGGHVGYGTGEASEADIDGFVGGVQGGFNWQMGQFLAGVEADVSYSGVGASGLVDSYDVDWLGTARGRVGFAFDRFVAYGTGGLAWANAEYEGPVSSDSNTHLGWTLGAGVEMALTERVSAKAEYLYMDFGSESYSGVGDIEPDLHNVRLGVNYRF